MSALEDDLNEIMSQCASAESVAAFNRVYAAIMGAKSGFTADALAHFEKAMATPTMGRVSVDYSKLFTLLILARKGAYAEGMEVTPIPQHMRENPGERHPQTDEEHNPQNDPIGGGLARSEARLCYAADYADPRAPDQMALVWRIDLLRVTGDWQHKRAFFNHVKDIRPPAVTITESRVSSADARRSGGRSQRCGLLRASKPRLKRKAEGMSDLDVCRCGDYRRDHVGGSGLCKFNLPYNIGHGGPANCLEFRMSEPAKGFHWRDGVYFARNDDGSVYVSIPDMLDAPVREITIPPAEWCSIVAAVSASGSASDAVAAISALHSSTPSPAKGDVKT